MRGQGDTENRAQDRKKEQRKMKDERRRKGSKYWALAIGVGDLLMSVR
jgi:hypothetical protein